MKTSDDVEKHMLLGHKYFFDQPRDVEAAMQEFLRVTELAPNWSEGLGWLSASLEELGQTDEAIAVIRKAINIAPKDSRYLTSLGKMLVKKGEHLEAVEVLTNALSSKPNYGEADIRMLLAEALIALSMNKKAYQECKAVLKLEPSYPSYEGPLQEAKRMIAKYRLNK